MARKITLQSPLAPIALANKLKSTLGGKKARPKAGVTGHGTDRDIVLFVYRPHFSNSFATSLTATMEPEGSGTRIAGRIGPPASGTVFLWVWNGFLILFMAGILLAIGASGNSGLPWSIALFPLGMIGFGWFLWWVGTRSDKADQAAILKFLADTVEASTV